MTDLAEAVRACAEWLGWEWHESNPDGHAHAAAYAYEAGCGYMVVPAYPNDDDWDHFTAHILDKLEAGGIGINYDFDTINGDPCRQCVVGGLFREGSASAYTPTRAEAIIRATHEYLKARQQ